MQNGFKKERTEGQDEGRTGTVYQGFALESYIGYQDCRLEDRGRGGGGDLLHELFIKDEIREQKGRRKLILFLGAGKRNVAFAGHCQFYYIRGAGAVSGIPV